ncbi:hypothetical protein ABIC63_003660 [Pseudacidovorax sp. 1753]|uniref:trypsin-like peptidase domain-containing protein n=1 Tax=Pseudacidovorax sp. 1753 TaxID=3156419 RepID=UPI0033914B98
MASKHVVPSPDAVFSSPDPFEEFLARRTPEERASILARQKQANLGYTAVRLQCLDSAGQEIRGAYASGFVRLEGGKNFLYTCWHVVSGYGAPLRLAVKHRQDRAALRVFVQLVEKRGAYEAIGGLDQLDLPLLDSTGLPLWLQEPDEQEQPDLNAIGLRVPRNVDVVKLEMPSSFAVSSLTLLREEFSSIGPLAGDRISVVGYPHGYSADGEDDLTAVVLTRNVAAGMTRQGLPHRLIVDGPGTPGMSGAPVFIWDQQGHPRLFGIYSGIIHPGTGRLQHHEYAASLGECFRLCNLCGENGPGLVASGALRRRSA